MLEHRDGGCHCGQVRFRARVDLDLLSQCSCTVCTKKGILHISVAPENFELLRGKNSLSTYTFGTGVAQHTFCSQCGMHAFYVPRSQPDRITVNARCLDDYFAAQAVVAMENQHLGCRLKSWLIIVANSSSKLWV